MTEPTLPQPAPQAADNPAVMAFADDAAFRQRMADMGDRVIGMIDKAIDARVKAQRSLNWQIVASLSGLTAIVILTAGVLTFTGKMSADATAFLIGAVVGAAFTFSRDVLLPPTK